MTNEEIIENNKLIATFMQLPFWELDKKRWFNTSPSEYGSQSGYWREAGKYYEDPLDYNLIRSVHESKLQYNTDWNWLMMVVEKIEALDQHPRVTHSYTIEITGNGSTAYKSITSGDDTNIIFRHNIRNERRYCTWVVVVEFIKWYNAKNQAS